MIFTFFVFFCLCLLSLNYTFDGVHSQYPWSTEFAISLNDHLDDFYIPGIIYAKKTNSSETRLLEYILDGYNREVRPIKNISEPVRVRMGLNLKQITSVVSMLTRSAGRCFWQPGEKQKFSSLIVGEIYRNSEETLSFIAENPWHQMWKWGNKLFGFSTNCFAIKAISISKIIIYKLLDIY